MTIFPQSVRAQVLLVIVCVVGAVMVGWSAFKTKFYRAAIPAEIGLTFGLAVTGSNISFWEAALVPMRAKACGGAIFELTDAAAVAIRERGLHLLNQAQQGRGYADSKDHVFHYYSYKPWQPTPLPPQWTSQGAWYGLNCMNLGYSFARSIVEAAEAPGSFYTTGLSKVLLIVPRLKLAVLTYTS